MKNMLFAALLAVLVSVPVRGEDTHETLVEEGLKVFNGLADVLGSIKDKEGGEKAKGELRKMAVQLNDLKTRGEKLGEPSEARKLELEKKYKPKVEEVMKKVQGEMLRIAMKVDGGPAILTDLNSIVDFSAKK